MMRTYISMAGAAALLAGVAAAGPMSVQVKHSPVRGTPSFLGPVVATLAYGERVDAGGEKNGWVEVRTAAGQAGWMHASALTKKALAMSAGATAGTGATSDELSLAGKGFSADVEAKFRADHPTVDFAWVDRMEAMRVDAIRAAAFLRTGGLTAAAEGGQP